MWVNAAARSIGMILVRLGLWVFLEIRRALGSAQRGQSMVEYAIVVALVALVAMVAVQALGESITRVFQNIVAQLNGIGG
jgi:Flp pilus assembly pilin Flp